MAHHLKYSTKTLFKISLALILAISIYCFSSCKKLITIPPPASTITTSQVFADSVDAVAAISGLYNDMINNGSSPQMGDGLLTLDCGSSADELVPFGTVPDFYTNTLTAFTGSTNQIWSEEFSYIYLANACIENLQASKISASTKNQLIGEAKFFRGFFYFYLVNLFGDVPLILTTNYKINSLVKRVSSDIIYQQIIKDLQDAQSLLPSDYTVSRGERVRVNKLAATAFLARVYLYRKEWKNAEAQASTVIDNGQFKLVSNLDEVFLKNSSEAILQWQINVNYFPFNCTPEGYVLVDPDPTNAPNYYVSSQLLDAFETADKRKISWLDTANYSGTKYYYPYKYKQGPAQSQPNTPATEYYTVLRLGEQYLIRAEARAQLGESSAVNDLNVIRNRAGLSNYSGLTDNKSLLTAIYHERQVELFAEWGHRWLDLKRTGQIDAVMRVVTPLKGGNAWQSYQQLYPIPYGDIQFNANLTQNPGY